MHSAASCCSPSRSASLRRRFELRRRGPEPAPFVVIASDLENPHLAFRQPFEIYTVHLSETGNLMVFELQDRLDLLVRKGARCCYVPAALPTRLFDTASARPGFAVRLTHRMRGERGQIVGDCAFDPFRFHVGVTM